MPLIPTPFPEKSLKHEYAYRQQVKALADSRFSEEQLGEVLKFRLSGLDFFKHRDLILNGIEQKRPLSARIGGADISINQLSYNGPNTGSIADIEAIVHANGLSEFYERFNAANPQARQAPFVFYQYAFVRELRLLKMQTLLLEREGNRAFLENHYDTVPQKIEEFVYSKVREFKAIMDGQLDESGRVIVQGIFDYPRKRCIEQILAVRGGKLNPALTDPCVRPFVSKIEGVRVGGAISSDQLLGYESIDAAAKDVIDNHSRTRRVQGALAEIFMKTGGGKTYMSEKVKQNYVSERGLFNDVLNFSLNSTQAELEILQGEGSLERKIVQLDEAYFYGRYERKSDQTAVEEARNDLIEKLIKRGALVVTLGASESLAKIKVDLRELDVKILQEEELLKYEDQEARKEVIDNGKKAVKGFRASTGYVSYKADKTNKLRYQEALEILREIKRSEDEGRSEGMKKAARKFLKFSEKMHKQNPGESILVYFRKNLKIQDDPRKERFSIDTSNLSSYIDELERKLAETFTITEFGESHWKKFRVREAPHLKAQARNFLPYIKILVDSRRDITADLIQNIETTDLIQNIETIERLLVTNNNSELAELYKAFFSIVTHPDIMSDFNSNNIESTKLVDLKAKRTSRMAQYNELVVRREGGKVNGREVRGKTQERFDIADKFVDQSDFGTVGNLYDLVGKYLDKISDRNSEGVKGRMQYVMPHFKITEANCSIQVLEQIRVKTEADIIIIPQKEGDDPLRCRVYCQEDRTFVEMNLGESRAKIERELAKLEENRSGLSGAALENLELDIAGLRQTLARMPLDDSERYLCDLLDGLGEGIKDKKILSFFDCTNSVGGDYGAAGIGVTQQYIHVNDPTTLTWNELMQANRDRTPTANDDADGVKRKFIYHSKDLKRSGSALRQRPNSEVGERKSAPSDRTKDILNKPTENEITILKAKISQNTREDDIAHALGYIRSKTKSLRERGQIDQAKILEAYERNRVWDEDPLLERAREEELQLLERAREEESQRGMDVTVDDTYKVGSEDNSMSITSSPAKFVGSKSTTPLVVKQTTKAAGGGGGRASTSNLRDTSFSKLDSPKKSQDLLRKETKSETMKSSKSTELLSSNFAQICFDAAQEILQNKPLNTKYYLGREKTNYIQSLVKNEYIVKTGTKRYNIFGNSTRGKPTKYYIHDTTKAFSEKDNNQLKEVYESLSAALIEKRKEREKIEIYERKSKELLDLIIKLGGYDIDDESVSYENIARPANAKKTTQRGSFAKASVSVSGEVYHIIFESVDVIGGLPKTVAKFAAIASEQHHVSKDLLDQVLDLLQKLKDSAAEKISQKVDYHKKIISARIRENQNEILQNQRLITSWEIKHKQRDMVLFVKKEAIPSQGLNNFAVRIDVNEEVLVAKANRHGQLVEKDYYLYDVLEHQKAILDEIALNKNEDLFRQILGEDSRGNIKDGDYEFSSSSAKSPQIGGVKFGKNGANYTVKIGQNEYDFSRISLEEVREMYETVSRLMESEELDLTDKLKKVLFKVEADENLEDIGYKDFVTSISKEFSSGWLICDLDYTLKMLGNVEQGLGDLDKKRKAVDDLRVVTRVDGDVVVLDKKFYKIESKFQVSEIDVVQKDGTINEVPRRILLLEDLKKLTSDFIEKKIEDVKLYQQNVFAHKKYLKSWKVEQNAADVVSSFTKTTPPEYQFYTQIGDDGSLHIRLPGSENYLEREQDQIAYSKKGLHFILDQYDEMLTEIRRNISQVNNEIVSLFEEVFHHQLDKKGDNLQVSQSVFTSGSENHKAGSISINSDLVKATVKVAGGVFQIRFEQEITNDLPALENVRNQLQQDIEREKKDQLRKIDDSLEEIERNKKFLPKAFKLEGKRLSKGKDIIIDVLSESSRLGDVRLVNDSLQKINEFIAQKKTQEPVEEKIKEVLLRISQDIFAPDSEVKQKLFGDELLEKAKGNLLLRDEQNNSLCVLDPSGVLRIKEDIRAEELLRKLSEIEQEIAATKIDKSKKLLGSMLDKIFADEDSIFYEGRTLRRVLDGEGKVVLDVLDEETNTKHSYSFPDPLQAAQYQGAEVKTHQLESLEVLLEGVTQQLEEENTRRQKLASRMRSARVITRPDTTKSEVYAELSRAAINSDKGLATVEFVVGFAEEDRNLAQELDKAKTQEAKYKVAKAHIAKNPQLGAGLEEFIKSKGISTQDHQKRTYALIESEFAKMDKSSEQRSPSPTLTARMHNLFKTESVQAVKSNGDTGSGGTKGGGGQRYK